MGKSKEYFFSKNISDALDNAVKAYQEKYTKKKGRRFNVNDITYELGVAKVEDNCLEFEMSNKIPEAEIREDYTIEQYFKDVKKTLSSFKSKASEIGMDEIVKRESENEVKTRDYVRLKFRYNLSELYNEKELLDLYEDIKSGKSSMEIKKVSGVNSLLGPLALNVVESKVYSLCTQNMENLMKANDKVRSKNK